MKDEQAVSSFILHPSSFLKCPRQDSNLHYDRRRIACDSITPRGQGKVDPILWTKKGHSLATLLPAFLTGNSWLVLHRRHACGIDFSPGETEVGSAGEHPAKG